jgi:hypothetical protein
VGGEQAAFALLDCKPRLLRRRPAIAISFTQPLDGKQDFGALVTAWKAAPTETDGKKGRGRRQLQARGRRWVLGDNPRVLYLPS